MGQEKTSLKSNLEYLLVQIRPKVVQFPSKKVYFLFITQCRHVTRRKMGGARICGLCVFCSAFNSLTNFFFLLVTTPGVIIKREFNSKTVSETIPGEPITLDQGGYRCYLCGGENRWRPQVPDKWPGITVNRGIVCRGERRSCVGHRQMSEGARGHESGKFPPSRFIETSAGDTGA